MNILFLYAQMVPSWKCVFEELVKKGYHIHVVHWDHKKKTPYEPELINGVTYYKRSCLSKKELKTLAVNLNPRIIFVSGWMDWDYLFACFFLRRIGLPVVFGCDDWWRNTLKQKIGSLIPNFLRRKLISHGWVAGPRQYEYCKRLGFEDNEIIHNFLTCDTKFFNVSSLTPPPPKNRTFIFVGRFSEEKGVRNLIKAYNYYKAALGGTWRLICVGNGPLKKKIADVDDIEIKDFSNMHQLRNFYARSSVFVLPSFRDFSPLVLHEAVSMGLPILISDKIGNAAHYSVKGYNSIEFSSDNWLELASCLHKFEKFDTSKLEMMGSNSLTLSVRNNPKIAAESFLSIVAPSI